MTSQPSYKTVSRLSFHQFLLIIPATHLFQYYPRTWLPRYGIFCGTGGVAGNVVSVDKISGPKAKCGGIKLKITAIDFYMFSSVIFLRIIELKAKFLHLTQYFCFILISMNIFFKNLCYDSFIKYQYRTAVWEKILIILVFI